MPERIKLPNNGILVETTAQSSANLIPLIQQVREISKKDIIKAVIIASTEFTPQVVANVLESKADIDSPKFLYRHISDDDCRYRDKSQVRDLMNVCQSDLFNGLIVQANCMQGLNKELMEAAVESKKPIIIDVNMPSCVWTKQQYQATDQALSHGLRDFIFNPTGETDEQKARSLSRYWSWLKDEDINQTGLRLFFDYRKNAQSLSTPILRSIVGDNWHYITPIEFFTRTHIKNNENGITTS
jgi:hypothetical protein